MIYTGYADFWFQEVSLPERMAKFAALGIKPIDIWMWRAKGVALMDETAAACRECGCHINSTFDESAGSLTDANDHAHCLDAWAESLDVAGRWGVKHLFIFSEQIDPYTPPQGVSTDVNGWTKPGAPTKTALTPSVVKAVLMKTILILSLRRVKNR